MTRNKRITIPLEVWERTDLGWAEKILFAEIASYTSRGRECCLTTSQIATFLAVKERRAQMILASLVNNGLVIVENFDGRCRKLRPCGAQNCAPAVHKTAPLRCTKLHQTNIISSDIDISSDIKEKIYKKENGYNFRGELLSLGVSTEAADDWLKVRKTKRATNTRIALEAIAKEIRKSGKPADYCIRTAVVNSWAGFRAEWLENAERRTAPAPKRENYVEAGMRVADELLGTNYMEQLNTHRNGRQ